MKKILLSIAFALMGIASGFAAKAYSGIITVTQSDGTELNVRIYGDEHFNWLTTEDGVLLFPQEDVEKAFRMGCDAAYKAVMKPTEGTILTLCFCRFAFLPFSRRQSAER